MKEERKLTDIIFKFCDKETYKCAFLNINNCLSHNECIQDKCDRYKYCAGNNLSHIDLYVEKLELENKQLKKQNEKEFADYTKFKQEQYDEYLDKTNKLIKERQHYKHQLDLYKSVIDEVRKIIFNNCVLTQFENALVELPVEKVHDVLEILDKVSKGSDKE